MDPRTGEVVWQTANPTGGKAGGAASVANGVVYVCSLDPDGHMYALDAGDGSVLWDFDSGGSCNSGAAIVEGKVYWGSGYGSAFDPVNTTGDLFYSFGLPGAD